MTDQLNIPGQVPATPASQTPPNGVDQAALRALVDAELTKRVGNDETFTAFDVTNALRAANPGQTIPHFHGVREHVHGLMGNFITVGGPYTATMKDFVDPQGQPYQAYEYAPA